MSDYIKREDAINAFQSRAEIIDGYTACAIIRNIPSADVVERCHIGKETIEVGDGLELDADTGFMLVEKERKRGKWKYIREERNQGIWECSECHNQKYGTSNYCPCCGAYMRKSCANGCKWSELDGSCSNPKGLCEIEYRWQI